MADVFAERLRELIAHRGISYRQLAASVYYSKSHVHDLASGKKPPTQEAAERLDRALGGDGELVALLRPASGGDDTLDAYELGRRVAASDVSADTLDTLELAFDDLATAYPSTPPADLLRRVRRRATYATHLLDGKLTLAQHRRLVVVSGWLSLLAATLHIDLRNHRAAQARLSIAARAAAHAEHLELQAWCVETTAWSKLINGDFNATIELSRQAQTIAPKGSSVHIQATAQEGRGWARLHDVEATRAVLARIERLVSSLPVPERPEHHYRYDPAKALSYTATTLAWAGDPAAEEYTRSVIVDMESGGVTARPRRAALARLDLGLALLAADKPDEASAVTILAITSGRLVPSTWWRATEILTGVERSGIHELHDLRDAYETFRP